VLPEGKETHHARERGKGGGTKNRIRGTPRPPGSSIEKEGGKKRILARVQGHVTLCQERRKQKKRTVVEEGVGPERDPAERSMRDGGSLILPSQKRPARKGGDQQRNWREGKKKSPSWGREDNCFEGGLTKG